MTNHSRRLYAQLVCACGLQSTRERRAVGAPIVVYHGVLHHLPDKHLNPYSIDSHTFIQHLKFFKNRFEVVPLQRILARLKDGTEIPSRWIAITMDDALMCQTEIAAPILQKFGFPWSLAVPANLVGKPRSIWSNELRLIILKLWRKGTIRHPETGESLPTGNEAERIRTLAQLRNWIDGLIGMEPMLQFINQLIDHIGEERFHHELREDCNQFTICDWKELRELAHDEVELISHGSLHLPHSQLTPKELESEVIGSRKIMMKNLGFAPDGFAIPLGASCKSSEAVIAAAGYSYCLTSQSLRVTSKCNPFQIPRFDAEYSLPVLRRHLTR